MSEELVCQVCERNTAVGVAAVPGVPYSAAYCKGCLEANAHPLGVLIANTSICGGFDECADWWQHMVTCTLAHLNRTLLWFNSEVDQNMAEIAEEELRLQGETNTTVSFDITTEEE